jgi:predicted nucleic acid-binding protein
MPAGARRPQPASVEAPAFVDTNVLLYALDTRDPAKQAQAAALLDRLWATGLGRVSWQVLHEFYINATGKLRLDSRLARAAVASLSQWQPVETTLGLLQEAWNWCDHARVAYWDALILAAANRSGAAILYSEDFQHGRAYGGCRAFNPFA